MYFELFTGFRYLVNRQKHAFISLTTFLSVAGVAVGVMTLIVVIAVMTGAEYDLRTRILGSQPHFVRNVVWESVRQLQVSNLL